VDSCCKKRIVYYVSTFPMHRFPYKTPTKLTSATRLLPCFRILRQWHTHSGAIRILNWGFLDAFKRDDCSWVSGSKRCISKWLESSTFHNQVNFGLMFSVLFFLYILYGRVFTTMEVNKTRERVRCSCIICVWVCMHTLEVYLYVTLSVKYVGLMWSLSLLVVYRVT
jgi:hypothetical protein